MTGSSQALVRSSRPIDVIVMGSAFAEFVPTPPGVRLPLVRSFRPDVGGSATNIAVAAARLGGKVGLMSAVGDDDLGEFVLDKLRREGIDVSRVRKIAEYATGVSLYATGESGQKRYYFYRFPGFSDPEASLSPSDVDARYVRSAKAIAFTEACVRRLPSRAWAVKAAKLARKGGGTVFYDPNFRPSLWKSDSEAASVNRQVVALSNVVTPNEEEALLITGTSRVDRAIDMLLELGPQLVAVKQGAKGCVIANERQRVHVPAFKVRVVDDTGAGDAFCAALTLGFLRGLAIREMGVFANAAAALKVSRPGTREAMPRLREVRELMRSRRLAVEGLS